LDFWDHELTSRLNCNRRAQTANRKS
jgi:hypothetical protein